MRANLEIPKLRPFYHIQKSSGTHWKRVGGTRARLDAVKRYSFPCTLWPGGVGESRKNEEKEKGKGKKAE